MFLAKKLRTAFLLTLGTLTSLLLLLLYKQRTSRLPLAASSKANTGAVGRHSHCWEDPNRIYLVTLSSVLPKIDDHFMDLAGELGIDHRQLIQNVWNIGRFRGYSIRFRLPQRCLKFWTLYEAGRWQGAISRAEMDYQLGVEVQAVQNNPPWGLDRIDQTNLQLDGIFDYPNASGEGIDIYIVDTGINLNHTDFEGRAIWGTTTRSDDAQDIDDNGHGSHVAGIAGGKTYGVAKKARLIAVKALDQDGRGPFSELIDGLQWVAQHAPTTGRTSVVNLSIQGLVSEALNTAVTGLLDLGVHVVSATGNSGKNSCDYSPAVITGNTSVISVGAVDDTDTEADFSNYGNCVSIMGPGVRILSIAQDSVDGTKTMSGTSMAAPHVSGVLALLLSAATTNKLIPTDTAGLKHYLLLNVAKELTAKNRDDGAVTSCGVLCMLPTMSDPSAGSSAGIGNET
ncbi:peptidase S8/S53 domain-containing protein [Phlyctochytrium arcticum]|nr:peptidase S8/S53 domain-containing protein [Phlyctochytrium arcticum]